MYRRVGIDSKNPQIESDTEMYILSYAKLFAKRVQKTCIKKTKNNL